MGGKIERAWSARCDIYRSVREQGRYIGRPAGAGGRGFFWASFTGVSGWGLTYMLTYDSIDIRGQAINRKDNMKEELLKALQHEIAICDKLDAEYKDEYFERLGAGEEVKARCLDDLRTQIHGEKYGLETAIKYIESILK